MQHPPLPEMLAERERRHPNSALPATLAWRIALSWHSCLRGKVRLDIERSDGNAVVRRYAWISLYVSLSQRREVSFARATAIVWFALSCCVGYSASENPVFWKCVFSELWQMSVYDWSRKCAVMAADSITDADLLFKDDEFPRFQLRARTLAGALGEEANLALFCGVPGFELEPDDASRLSVLMAQLEPWIDASRATRRVLVSLVRVPHASLSAPSVTNPKRPLLHSLLDTVTQTLPSDPLLPPFVIHNIEFSDDVCFDNAEKVRALVTFMQSHAVDIELFECRVEKAVTSPRVAMLVQSVLAIDGSRVAARTTSLSLTHVNVGATLAPFVSALPFARSTRTLQISTRRDVFESHDFVWLAYAIFHPHTPSSSWKQLQLEYVAITHRSIAVLEAMSRGNNLAALLDGREPTSDGYYQATLNELACVYTHPNRSQPLQVASAYLLLNATMVVDVCDVATDDPRQWSEWVAVVVPAYGLAWIQSVDVVQVIKHTPAPPSLELLYISHYNTSLRDDAELAVSALRFIGAGLRHLSLERYSAISSADVLHRLLAYCPNLESLAVNHDGHAWSGDWAETPSLRALQLRVTRNTPDMDALRMSRMPRSLEYLRVVADTASDLYTSNRDAIRQLLASASTKPNLLAFHWEERLRFLDHSTSYPEMCAASATRFEALDLEDGPSITGRMVRACVVAFLSVLACDGLRSQVDEGVAKTIVAFAGSATPTSIVLAPVENE